MVAELFVKRIINGDNTFSDVPRGLRQEVASKLIENGYSKFVPVEYGGSLKL